MGPVQILSNITTALNIAFQEPLALTRVRHMVNSKRVMVQIPMH